MFVAPGTSRGAGAHSHSDRQILARTTQRVETTSHVTLDCRGALIRGEASPGSRGIEIEAPEGTDLVDVTVRRCRVEGFLNGLRVTREGFRDLEPGAEYRNETFNDGSAVSSFIMQASFAIPIGGQS